MRSTPISVSFWTAHSGRSPLTGAKPTVSKGLHRGCRRTSPVGSQRAIGLEPTQPPAAPAIGDAHRLPRPQSQRFRQMVSILVLELRRLQAGDDHVGGAAARGCRGEFGVGDHRIVSVPARAADRAAADQPAATFGKSRHFWRKSYTWCTTSSISRLEGTKVEGLWARRGLAGGLRRGVAAGGGVAANGRGGAGGGPRRGAGGEAGTTTQPRTLGTYLKALRSLDMKPASGGATSSPRTSASRRSSSSCSLLRSVGVSTTTVRIRSPRPRPCRCGTPRPRRRISRPLWVPAGMVSCSSPSRVSNGNPGPEGGLRHPHVDHGQQVGAVAGQGGMVAHPHVHVQVSGRPAAPATGAPAREPQAWSRGPRRRARRPQTTAPRAAGPLPDNRGTARGSLHRCRRSAGRGWPSPSGPGSTGGPGAPRPRRDRRCR